MVHLKLITMAFLYAGGFIAGKVAVEQSGPFTIAFIRFFISTSILFALVIHAERKLTLNRDMLCTAIGAAFLGIFCYNYLFLTGVKYIDAARGAVIVSMVPIVVGLASVIFLNEKHNFFKGVGIILSLIGAWTVITRGDIQQIWNSTIGRGEWCMMGCVVCAVAFTFLSKRMLRHTSPLMTMACISGIGTMLVLMPAIYEMYSGLFRPMNHSFALSMMYLAIGPSVIGVVFYYQAMNTVGASRATQYMNLMPVFAVILAVIFLDEQLTGSLVVGGGLVTTGLYLSNINT